MAKQAADLDLFSGGRLRLGVGAGWNWVEFDALEVGEHFARRGKREEQQIELMRRLWTEELVSYDDGVHKVERANILPRPGAQFRFGWAVFRRWPSTAPFESQTDFCSQVALKAKRLTS